MQFISSNLSGQHTKFKSVSDVASAGSKSAPASIAHEFVATSPGEEKSFLE